VAHNWARTFLWGQYRLLHQITMTMISPITMTKVTITTMLLSEEAPCSGEAAEGREGVSGQEMVVATSQNTWRIGEGT